ncbi:hypothetical protein CWB41_13870 [Methylovirgula ligni]|uniref:Uncharacterized protein n=1 Tax=Methylovirgula ligni TaxID=569860 RepID=A0A3D9YWJ6_9HYPH|nr:hypothetical protein [Methylovirgula ligni]QAY96681.1 hypothetical protein CWB41_13870 [Methylovirgula ligni]REF83279.1 hypothetical protein DES32_3195 [Methylovirgula ligni]
MSAATYVDDAREMAAALEEREARLAGSLAQARRNLAARFGIAARIFYALRHRPPKTITADIYDRLCAALEVSAAQGIRTLQHEMATAHQRRLRLRQNHARKAALLVGEARQELALIRSESREGGAR